MEKLKKKSGQTIRNYSDTGKCPLCDSPAYLSFQSKDFFLNSYNYYKYFQCNNCHLIFQYPIPEKKQIEHFYPSNYAVHQLPKESTPSKMKTAILHYKYNYKHLHPNWFFRCLAPVCSAFLYKDTIPYFPHTKTLDIGCGNGKFILFMNKIGWEMEGIDFSHKAVESCRKAGLTVYLGDLSSTSFKDNSFELLSSRHVIEHLQTPEEFIIESKRILKKGGKLVIRTPNSDAFGRSYFGPYWYANDVPRHIFLFNMKNLDMLAKRHGLKLLKQKNFATPKIFLNSWDLLKNTQGIPSKKKGFHRLVARIFALYAELTRQGDEIFAIYEKK